VSCMASAERAGSQARGYLKGLLPRSTHQPSTGELDGIGPKRFPEVVLCPRVPGRFVPTELQAGPRWVDAVAHRGGCSLVLLRRSAKSAGTHRDQLRICRDHLHWFDLTRRRSGDESRPQ
jgi:hypothetical protein